MAYAHTRTAADFGRDVRAWVASWGVPAELLLGGRKGKGRPGQAVGKEEAGYARDSIPERYSWLRKGRGGVRFYDLDRMNRPDTVGKMLPLMQGAMAKGRTRRLR